MKQDSGYKFHYGNPKLRLDLQSHKTLSFLLTITLSLNIQIEKIVYRSDLETAILASFPLIILNYRAINLLLQKLPTIAIAEFTTSLTTDITLQTNVKFFRSNSMYSASTPDCRYDNSIIKLIGNVYRPNAMCLDILCVHKMTFQSFEGTAYYCPQFSSTFQVRNIPFVGQINSLFFEVWQGFYNLEGTKKTIQDVISDVCCQRCRNEKRAYLSTKKSYSFYDCKKCKPALKC